ncbi:MAG: hypothetical protein J0I32_08170 [Sphingobacteriales bacterium]|nr:hypothetical protein [Sphingobacteriales bacterium]
MRKLFLLLLLIGAFVTRSSAQHEHHKMQNMQEKKDTIPGKNKMEHEHAMEHDQGMGHPMSHAYSLNLPMSRNGSGTSWLPDETPMYMYMTGKKTMWMFHGSVFLRYTNTNVFNKGIGADKFDAPNWFMVMMNRRVGKKGLFSAKAMISLDRLTEGGNGYPLLFQSGETYKGNPLVNRQHPHDLFAELSVGYSYAINKHTDVFAYFGYPGEPAISAPAFMHRVSAMNNPDAPLGHHWQDATHITFGVGTLGFRYKQFKLEGSIFTGREPDEERYGFDKARFDSYSYRLSYNPSPNWALQFSQGFINEPELLEPGVDVTRTTASVLYAKKTGKAKDLNAALIWGFNNKGEGHKEHSLLLEENYRFGRNALYSRYEWVQKSTEELALEDQLGHKTFDVHVFTAGYNRGIWKSKVVDLAAGTQVTLNFPASGLKPVYGNLPVGFQVYLQLRPVLQ